MANQLNINVRNLSGEFLKEAVVELQSFKNDQIQKVKFDREKDCFKVKNLPTGKYNIRVNLDGYDPQERLFSLNKSKATCEFILGKDGSLYLPIGESVYPIVGGEDNDIIIYDYQFENNKDAEDNLSKKRTRKVSSPEKYTTLLNEYKLDLRETETNRPNLKGEQGFRVVIKRKLSKIKKKKLIADLRNVNKNARIGISIDPEGKVAMDNKCIVRFNHLTKRDLIESIIKQCGAVNYAKDSLLSYTFTLEFSPDCGIEILDLISDLKARDEVDSVSAVLIGPSPETHALNPNVFHWPSQWPKHLMKLGEAWEDLLNDPTLDNSLKFGDPKILVAVLDDGTETENYDAANPSINGYVNSTLGAAATLSSAVTAGQSTFDVLDGSFFTGGDEILVGGTPAKVDSVTSNSLKTTPIVIEKKSGTEVINLTTIGNDNFLDGDLTPVTSFFQIQSLTGGSFTVGQEITVGYLNLTKIESVLITQIDGTGTGLTTSPLRFSHGALEPVFQGKKLLRAVDFGGSNTTEVVHNDSPESFHGSAVASIMAAKADTTYGMAGSVPNARIVAARRFGGGFATKIQQFKWILGVEDRLIIDTGITQFWLAKLQEVAVLNSSIAWSDNVPVSSTIREDFYAMIRRTRNRRGTPIFLSAGNGSKEIGNILWAGIDRVITVGASSVEYNFKDDLYKELKASYSNFSDVENLPDIKVDFCAPTNNSISSDHRNSHRTPPAVLGEITAGLKGQGNVIDKSDGSNIFVTSTEIFPSVKIEVAVTTSQNYIKVAPSIGSISPAPFNTGDWVRIGNSEINQWRKVSALNVVSLAEVRLEFTSNVTEDFQKNDEIQLAPPSSIIERGLVPGADTYRVDSVKSFKADDWFILGKEPYDTKWMQIDSVNAASKTIKVKPAFVDATSPVQVFGPKKEAQLEILTAAASGTDKIDIKLNSDIVGQYLNIGSIVKVNKSGTDYWFRVTTMFLGPNFTVSGNTYTGIQLEVTPNLPVSFTTSNIVIIPKIGYTPYIQGSTDLQVNTTSGFSSNQWIQIEEPDLIGNMRDPRYEFSNLQSVVNPTTLRISGPYHNHVQNTKVFKNPLHNYTDRMNGTSAASPHAAGVGALLYTVNPDLTWMEVRQILRNTAKKIDLNNGGFDSPTGGAPTGAGRWLNKFGNPIYKLDGTTLTTTPSGEAGTTDSVPVYSDWYGYGRINAFEAVKSARDHKTLGPDLMIRNYLQVFHDGSVLEDDGITETDLSQFKIDSPDIWVRNGFEEDGDSLSSALEKGQLPPHQPFDFSGDNSIYVRVTNRAPDAGGMDSYRAWVRVYLCLTDGEFDLSFLSEFKDDAAVSGYTSENSGIYFLGEGTDPALDPGGELRLYDREDTYINNVPLTEDGGIPKQNQYKVVTKWSNAILPTTDTHKRTYIIAEVHPHDGPLAEPYVHKNNNVSYKRVLFSNVTIQEDIGGALSDWPLTLNSSGTNFTKDFKISLQDREYIINGHIRIRVTRTSEFGVEERAVLSYNSTSSAWEITYEVENVSGWVTAPSSIPELSISTTVPSAPPNPGEPDLYEFSGSVTVRPTDSEIMIEAEILEPDVAEINHTAPTKPLVTRRIVAVNTQIINLPELNEEIESGLAPAAKPRTHVFADKAELLAQDVSTDINKFFGPDSSNGENIHHITTTFKGATPTNTINAYAVMSGRVIIQQDAVNSDKVNVFLKPLVQSGLGFTPVKYFVYRGLKTTDFLAGTGSPSNETVRSRPGASEYVESLYANVDNRNNAQTPTGSDTLSIKAMGWDPVNQTDLNRSLDDLFFNPDGNNEYQIVPQGTILGTFKNDSAADSFGFEIVLDDGVFVPTLEYARTSAFALNMTSISDELEKKLYREKVLSFVDPAAYFGMHELAGIKEPSGMINPPDVYDDFVSKFATKDRLYLDVRNENNYSYNYYGNYNMVDDAAISPLGDLGPNSFSMERISHDTSEYYGMDQSFWPYFMIHGGAIANDDYGLIYLNLQLNDNINPVVYIWSGFSFTPKSNERFIDGDSLIDGVSPTTKGIGFIIPKVDIGSPTGDETFTFKASVIKLTYSRRIPTGIDAQNVVLPTEKYYDNVFGPLELVLVRRPIADSTPGTNTFTIEGNYTDSLSSGDVLNVENSDAGQNDQIYTVSSVSLNGSNQTEVIVNESFTGSSVPHGNLRFSTHLWSTSLPTKWFSGPTKTFIDASTIPNDGGSPATPLLGFSYMGNTGVALDNNRIVFYATPHHFLDRSDERTVNQLNLTGGIGPSDSFWDEVIKKTPDLALSSTTLKISGSYLPVFEFEQTDPDKTNPKDDNLMALGITETEFNQVKRAIFESDLLPTHHLFFRLTNEQVQNDDNGVPYTEHELSITGWKVDPTDASKVVYNEISSATSLPVADPVKLYSIAHIGVIYTSEDYVNLEVINDEKKTVEEERVVHPDAISALSNDPTIAGLVTNFQSNLSSVVDDNSNIDSLLNVLGSDLFNQAVSTSAPYDPRPLYWAQMNVRSSLKEHIWLSKQKKLVRNLIANFESKSRGIELVDFSNSNPSFTGVNFATAKKILVVGFDPTNLDTNLSGNVSNTSYGSSIALSLQNEIITSGGETGAIQSFILPMRYSDYKKQYKFLFDQYLNLTSADKVDMIVLLGDNDVKDYLDLDWLAAKARDGQIDNEGKKKGGTGGFGKEKLLPTTLPIDLAQITTSPYFFFDPSHITSNSSQEHLTEGTASLTIPTIPTGKPERGSAEAFIYNEIFYKLLRRRNSLNSSTAAGLVSVPTPGDSWSDIDTIRLAIIEGFKRGLSAI